MRTCENCGRDSATIQPDCPYCRFEYREVVYVGLDSCGAADLVLAVEAGANLVGDRIVGLIR
jgi:hypothetical protein